MKLFKTSLIVYALSLFSLPSLAREITVPKEIVDEIKYLENRELGLSSDKVTPAFVEEAIYNTLVAEYFDAGRSLGVRFCDEVGFIFFRDDISVLIWEDHREYPTKSAMFVNLYRGFSFQLTAWDNLKHSINNDEATAVVSSCMDSLTHEAFWEKVREGMRKATDAEFGRR